MTGENCHVCLSHPCNEAQATRDTRRSLVGVLCWIARGRFCNSGGGELRGSDLGWELWGETTPVPDRGTGRQRHNKFCRPAGKVLKALERQGRASSIARKTYTAWRAIGASR